MVNFYHPRKKKTFGDSGGRASKSIQLRIRRLAIRAFGEGGVRVASIALEGCQMRSLSRQSQTIHRVVRTGARVVVQRPDTFCASSVLSFSSDRCSKLQGVDWLR